MSAICVICDQEYDVRRQKIQIKSNDAQICLLCAEQSVQPTRCVVPMHKSNYTLITNRKELIGINSKGGLIK